MRHHAVTDKEMESFFRTPNAEARKETTPPQVVGYNAKGEETTEVDKPSCFAKQVTDTVTGNIKYWVKRAISGPDTPHLLNPQSVNYKPGDEKLVQQGRSRYEFSKVNQESFTFYLTFLRTSNQQFLRRAERVLD